MSFDNAPIQGYGGWGVNAPYMTPAYMANFRPRYTGDDNGNPYAQNTSVGQSLWTLGPGDMGYGADTLGTLGAHRYNVATSAFDAGMVGLQSVAIPLAAWGLERQFGRSAAWSAMGRTGANAVTGAMGAGARRVGLGAVATGASRLGLGAAMGSVGAFAGGMVLPTLAATSIASAADATFIDPYVSTRRGMDSMMANTYNQFISGQGGAASGGFGMSATRAQAISQALTEAGQRDFSLTGGTYNEIADNMMRAGIFQEVGDMDTDRIVDGVKKATSVLKMITRITGDNDIQNGVKTLAMLKQGGLDDIQQMGAALQQIRNASAVSGTSVSQIIDTIGNQGMVMAQQAGMRGVTGLLASADAYAGFSNARRSGLLSGAQMQALGGLEGMTQNLMSGTMTMASSPYARMIMQSGGAFGGGMSQNIAGWGQAISSDPLRAGGDWFANSGAYMDQAINQHGGARMTLGMLQDMARNAGKDPKDGLIIASMAQQAGLTQQEFRSLVEYDKAMRDPTSRTRAAEGRLTAQRADFATQMQQEGLGMIGVPIIGDMQLAYKQAKSNVLGWGAEVMSPITEAGAAVSDWWSSTDAGFKGTLLDHQLQSYVVSDDGEGMLFSFEGRSMITAPGVDREGKKVSQLSRLADQSQNKTISALNRAYRAATGEDKKKIGKAFTLISQGKHAEAAKLIGEIDAKTGGVISGAKDSAGQQKFLQEFGRKLDSGELQIKGVKTGIDADSIPSTGGALQEGAFMDAITKGESGTAGYDAKVYGNRFDAGFDPSQSSVSQVLAQQKLSRSRGGNSAVGKFQFIYPTLKELTDAAIAEGRLDPEQKFDKGVQDMLAKDLAMRHPDISAYVNSPNPTPEQEEKAMNALAEIWASFPMANGKSKYSNVSGNKAHISRNESRTAIQDLRGQVNKPKAPAAAPSTGDLVDKNDIATRLAAMDDEVTKADVFNYLGAQTDEAATALLNSGDVNKNLESTLQKVKEFKSTEQKATQEGSKVNWEGIVDIKDGISKLGSATVANTTQMEKLTNAIERQISQNSQGFFGNKPTVERLD